MFLRQVLARTQSPIAFFTYPVAQIHPDLLHIGTHPVTSNLVHDLWQPSFPQAENISLALGHVGIAVKKILIPFDQVFQCKIIAWQLTTHERQYTNSYTISHKSWHTYASWNSALSSTSCDIQSITCPLTTIVTTSWEHFIRSRTGGSCYIKIIIFRLSLISYVFISNSKQNPILTTATW